jgi:hypothetical protein
MQLASLIVMESYSSPGQIVLLPGSSETYLLKFFLLTLPDVGWLFVLM